MDPIFAAFGEKLASAEAQCLHGLLHRKIAMVHPAMQQPSETMSSAKWKQTFKDVPFAALAGGVGYGIGRTIAEVIGEHVAQGGQRPGWVKAVPVGLAITSMLGAYAGTRMREGLKQRREAAAK